MQFTINSFRQLFPDKIIYVTFLWFLVKIPDISLTAVKFPDISRFSRQVVILDISVKLHAVMNATSGITVDWSHISVIPIKSSQHDSNTQACRGSLHWSVSLATDAYSGGGGGVQLTGQWSFTAITTGVQAAATSNTRAWRPTELSKIICEDESTAASATTRWGWG